MIIAIHANLQQRAEIEQKNLPEHINIIWTDIFVDADIYFDLLYEDHGPIFKEVLHSPVFANAVIARSTELPPNYIRLNAWNGFLNRDIVEIAASNELLLMKAKEIMQALNWKYTVAPDEPGMIAARIIAMIINEAYFALGDNVSTKEEIDIAMRLGTNYPFGPFEWSSNIGLPRIYRLLLKLNEADKRYMPAPALRDEINWIA